jgi:hypothetical protein
MCPECITSVAMVAAGLSSAGGLGAVVASSLGRKRRLPAKVSQTPTVNIAEPPSASFAEWVAALVAAPPQGITNLELSQRQRQGEER